MTLTSVERRILWSTVEDFVGLWEVVHLIAGGCPDVADEDRGRVARTTVESLLTRGWIQIWRRDGAWGQSEPLSSDAAIAALVDAAHWSAPGDGAPNFLAASTRAGQALFVAAAE
jgi:hypothetical protein